MRGVETSGDMEEPAPLGEMDAASTAFASSFARASCDASGRCCSWSGLSLTAAAGEGVEWGCCERASEGRVKAWMK